MNLPALPIAAPFSKNHLPPVPDHFHRIAWFGISLAVPNEWTLRWHQGNRHCGVLILGDIREVRLEVRWQTPRSWFARRTPADVLRHKALLLERRLGANTLVRSDNSVRLCVDDDELFLHAGAERLYEIRWLGKGDPLHRHELIQDFLAMMPLAEAIASDKEWLWSINGVHTWLPPTAKLKQASLLPGATTLSFQLSDSQFECGSVSLADRLLRNAGSLRLWAKAAIPLVAQHPNGQWQLEENHENFRCTTRRFLHPVHHLLSLRHDPAANRILWAHHFGRGAAKIPVSCWH